MEQLKQLISEFAVDHLSGFSVADIPFYIFTLCMAAIWAWVLGRFYLAGTSKTDECKSYARHLLVLALGLTIAVTIVRFSIPLAIVFAGVLALIRYKLPAQSTRQFAYLFLILIVGIGCGAGHGVLTSIGLLLLLPILWWLNRTKTAE